jgi:hypothetical protein
MRSRASLSALIVVAGCTGPAEPPRPIDPHSELIRESTSPDRFDYRVALGTGSALVDGRRLRLNLQVSAQKRCEVPATSASAPPRPEGCGPVRVWRLRVQLVADGSVVAEQAVDGGGQVSLELDPRELTRPPERLVILVETQSVELTPEVDALLRQALAAWAPARAIPPATAPSSAAPASPSAPQKPESAAAVKLFGVPLATATQAEFEAAVARHGCKLRSRDGAQVAHFTLECLGLAGFSGMKVLYDDLQRVVTVKYSGNPKRDELARLLSALNSEYGLPATGDASSAYGTRTWDLPDGFELELAPKAFVTELVYTNRAAYARLKAAVEQGQRDSVEQLRQKRGTAF